MRTKRVYFYDMFSIFLMINILALAVLCPVFYVRGAFAAAVVSCGLACVLGWTYWLNHGGTVRFWAVYLDLTVILCVSVPAYWLLTGGIQGPLLYIMPVLALVVYMMGDPRSIIFFLLLQMLILGSLTAVQYLRPDIILYSFSEPLQSALILVSLLFSMGLLLLIIYYYEKRFVYERTMLKLYAEKLEVLSRTDRLTGILNHGAIKQKIDDEIVRAKRYDRDFSLLLLDVDNFKNINDTFGHSEGDRIMCRVAKKLEENLRRADSVGRYGGDEFLIVCPETGIEAARKIGEKILQLVQDDCSLGDVSDRRQHESDEKNRLPGFSALHSFAGMHGKFGLHKHERITVSIGIVSYHQTNAEDAEALFHFADNNLYEAKRRGKNQLVSHFQMELRDAQS